MESNRDKCKAPLKLVPMILEVSFKGKFGYDRSYLVCRFVIKIFDYIYLPRLKVPDAIPVENITSISVIDALVQIFSRTAFSKRKAM